MEEQPAHLLKVKALYHLAKKRELSQAQRCGAELLDECDCLIR